MYPVLTMNASEHMSTASVTINDDKDTISKMYERLAWYITIPVEHKLKVGWAPLKVMAPLVGEV